MFLSGLNFRWITELQRIAARNVAAVRPDWCPAGAGHAGKYVTDSAYSQRTLRCTSSNSLISQSTPHQPLAWSPVHHLCIIMSIVHSHSISIMIHTLNPNQPAHHIVNHQSIFHGLKRSCHSSNSKHCWIFALAGREELLNYEYVG